MAGKGDIERIHNWRYKHSINDLKKIVENKGYSAFAVGDYAHAALKKFDYQLDQSHCAPNGTVKIRIWHKGTGGVQSANTKPVDFELIKVLIGKEGSEGDCTGRVK